MELNGLNGTTWNWMTHMEFDDANGPYGSSVPCGLDRSGIWLRCQIYRVSIVVTALPAGTWYLVPEIGTRTISPEVTNEE